MILAIEGMARIVDCVVQATALLAIECLTHDEIAHIDHVAQLANIASGLHTLIEVFGFFKNQVKSIPSSLESQVTTHNAHIV